MKYEVQNQNLCTQTEGLKRDLANVFHTIPAFVNQVKSHFKRQRNTVKMVLSQKLDNCMKQ